MTEPKPSEAAFLAGATLFFHDTRGRPATARYRAQRGLPLPVLVVKGSGQTIKRMVSEAEALTFLLNADRLP